MLGASAGDNAESDPLAWYAPATVVGIDQTRTRL